MQHLPARIALDPRELSGRPLRIGLSMQAGIDLRNQAGAALEGPAAAQSPGDTPATKERRRIKAR